MASHSNRALCRSVLNTAVVFAFGAAALCLQISASSAASRSDSFHDTVGAIALKHTVSSITVANHDDGSEGSSINPTDAAPAIASPNSTISPVGASKVFVVTETGAPTRALAESGALPSGVSSNRVVPDVNHNPDAEPDSLGTFTDTPLTVSTGRLLDNDSDPDGDIIFVTSVTPGGGPNSGSVSLNGATITYTPAAGFNGQDTFNYTVSDGKGGTAGAIVTVTIGDRSSFRITSITDSPAQVDLTGTAIPGSFCVIQIADQVQGPYTDFTGTFQPAPDGSFEFQDLSTPHPGQRFYRVRLNN